jgi:hypothetical protein
MCHLTPAPDIEPEGRVDPVDALVIPRIAGKTETVVCLPEANRGMLPHQSIQGVDDAPVGLGVPLVPVRTAR